MGRYELCTDFGGGHIGFQLIMLSACVPINFASMDTVTREMKKLGSEVDEYHIKGLQDVL